MLRRILLVATAAGLVVGGSAGAQGEAGQALVTVTVSPDTVTVGEPFSVRVRVRAPKVATIRFPEVPAPAEGVDPVDPRAIEEGPTGEFLDRTAVYTFVAWDVGRRGPALEPVIVTVAGREQRHGVATARVIVRSLLPADSTEEQEPRAARTPVKLPTRLWQYIIAGVVLLTALVYFLWLRRKRKFETRTAVAPEAWTHAKQAFASLDELQLAESGEPGRHVIAHVDVLRAYIERRFPTVDATLDAPSAAAALAEIDFPLPVHRVSALLERDAELRFAQSLVATDEALALATEAREITANLQLAHEARLRAIERPPRPRRR